MDYNTLSTIIKNHTMRYSQFYNNLNNWVRLNSNENFYKCNFSNSPNTKIRDNNLKILKAKVSLSNDNYFQYAADNNDNSSTCRHQKESTRK